MSVRLLNPASVQFSAKPPEKKPAEKDLAPRVSPDGRKVVMEVKDLNLYYPTSKNAFDKLGEKINRGLHAVTSRWPKARMDGWMPKVSLEPWSPRVKPSEVHILKDVNLQVHENEIVGVVGESGCGKTTLGMTMANLVHGAKINGLIWVNGLGNLNEMTAADRQKMRRHLQVIFQNASGSLSPRMSVGQILTEGLGIHWRKERTGPLQFLGPRKLTKAELDQEATRLLEMVQMPAELKNRYPHELSGGQKQRIAVARALSVNPLFVFADEITSALDVSVQAEMLKLILDLKKQLKLSMLFVAHDLNVVENISDRMVVMYLGEIVEILNPKKDQQIHPYTDKLVKLSPRINATEEEPLMQGEVPKPTRPPSGCQFHTRCDRSLDYEKSADPAEQAKRRKCVEVKPDLVEVQPGQSVRCHHIEDILKSIARMEEGMPVEARFVKPKAEDK